MHPIRLLKLPCSRQYRIARSSVPGCCRFPGAAPPCHQSSPPHRRLNGWLGRLAFLPSLTPYSLWDVGHNVVHHGYTNLKDFDMVWQPHTLETYAALPAWRRALYRLYRSGWAPWLYYLVEIWWLRMFFPSERHMPSRRPIFFADCALALAA